MMGASDLFNMNLADLSGMNLDKNILYVSSILHKSFLEVNEEGTEAAVVTCVCSMFNKSCFPSSIDALFKCDRPFLFFIHDNQFKTILFMGKCSTPNSYTSKSPLKT
jgi:serine protease inhibitor